MKNKRNPFIAVSEIASKNRWCWKLTCTTCGATELRSSLQKIAQGFHPDDMEWKSNWLIKDFARNYRRTFPEDIQRKLNDIISDVDIKELNSVASFPDWLGYLGIVIDSCPDKFLFKKSILQQFVDILDKKSPAYKKFKEILDNNNRAPLIYFGATDLEIVELCQYDLKIPIDHKYIEDLYKK